MHPLLQRLPRIQSLAVFESAARLGSFTEAAKELGMTQPGVSRYISALERNTGIELFRRSANRVRLSPDGHALLEAVQGGFDIVDARLESLSRAASTFLLAANPGFAQRWLVPHLDQLQDVLGDTALRLQLFDRDRELEDGSFDAVVHLTSRTNAPERSLELFEEIVVPVASPEFAEANKLNAASEPTELLRVAKLHLDARDRQWFDWSGWFKAHGVSWSPIEARMSYNNYPLVIQDALEGRGVALAWRGLVDEQLDMEHLVPVGPDARHENHAYQFFAGRHASWELADRVGSWLLEMTGSPR